MSGLQDLDEYVQVPSPSLETFEERYFKTPDANAREKMRKRKARRQAQLQRQEQVRRETGGDNQDEYDAPEQDEDGDQYIVYGGEDERDGPPTLLYARVRLSPYFTACATLSTV